MEQHPVPNCAKLCQNEGRLDVSLLKPPAPNYTGPGAVQMLFNGEGKKAYSSTSTSGIWVYTKNKMVREKILNLCRVLSLLLQSAKCYLYSDTKTILGKKRLR